MLTADKNKDATLYNIIYHYSNNLIISYFLHLRLILFAKEKKLLKYNKTKFHFFKKIYIKSVNKNI